MRTMMRLLLHRHRDPNTAHNLQAEKKGLTSNSGFSRCRTSTFTARQCHTPKYQGEPAGPSRYIVAHYQLTEYDHEQPVGVVAKRYHLHKRTVQHIIRRDREHHNSVAPPRQNRSCKLTAYEARILEGRLSDRKHLLSRTCSNCRTKSPRQACHWWEIWDLQEPLYG